jgi:hypothetical protein
MESPDNQPCGDPETGSQTRWSEVITWSQAALSCVACAGSQKHAIEYSV